MQSSGSPVSSSAGQGRSGSPDYAPSDSPSQSLVVALNLPPALLTYGAHGKNDGGDDNGEEESLDDSSKDDFEGGLLEEIYDNSGKKLFYDSDGEFEGEAPDSDSDLESDGVVYRPIERDDDGNSQNAPVGQSVGEDYEQADGGEAGGGFTTK